MDDPFEESITNDDSPRGPGRPRTRQIREKGSVGRPRVRPMQDPSARRRGRPQVTPGSVADSIATDAIVSGQMTVKALNASVQGLQGAIGVFQKSVISPLATQVNNFSQAINTFNRSHQEYLKEQTAVSREIYETYKLIRKVGMDPIIRGAERSRLAISAVTDVMKEINDKKYQGKEYEQMISSLTSLDRKMNRMVTAGVVGTEATETFLREYYKSSKGTSKFLNAVTYAAEDIAEDIDTLKNDLNKYFRGRNGSRTVLQDHSDSLKNIEKNTKGMRTMMVLGPLISGAVALAKTAFRFNKYAATDLFTNVFGIKGRGGSKAKAESAGGFTAFQEASLGGYGDFAKRSAEGFERLGRGVKGLKGLGKEIADAWDHSKVKWFWDVGMKVFAKKWEKAGGIGVSIVGRVKRNYGVKNYKGPHGGGKRYYGAQEEAMAGISLNRGSSKARLNDLGDWESENEAQLAFTPEQLRNSPLTPRNKKFKKNTQGKMESKIEASMGRGAKVVSINPKSNTQISTADVSTPRKAWGSLTRIQGRILGVLQRLLSHVKGIDDHTDGLEDTGEEKKGILGKVLAGAGITGGLGALLMKNRKFLRGGKGGLSLLGKLVFGAAAAKKGFNGLSAVGKMGKLGGLGAGARVWWDALGWGNSGIGNGAMRAVGKFKNTKLGRSWLGRALRQTRVAAAGYGQGAGSRLLGAFAHSRKWGGDLLGNIIGGYKGFVAPRRSIEGFAKMANPTRGMSLLQRGGLLMDQAGASIMSGASKAGSWLKGAGAGIGAASKSAGSWLKGAAAGIAPMAAKGGGLLKGLGVFMKKLPILGGIVQIGCGIHDLMKGKVWDGIIGITMGILTAIPHTALAGMIGSVTWEGGKFLLDKIKNKNGLDNKKAQEQMLDAFGVKAQGSATNQVGGGGSGGSTNTLKPQQKDGIFAKIGKSLSGLGSSIKNSAETAGKMIGGAISSGAVSPGGSGGGGGSVASSNSINWNGYRHDKMLPSFQKKLNAAADEMYKATGQKLNITSAIRTNQRQAELYVEKYYFHKNPNTVAHPAYNAIVKMGGKTFFVKGTGGKGRTGHLVGGAIDCSNYNTFLPYARKHGISWQGKGDPVHFQVNETGPIAVPGAPVKEKPTGAIAIGDPPVANQSGGGSGIVPLSGSSSSVGSIPAGSPNPSPSKEFSPMIQDYGLAIINNLLFT